MEENAKLMLYMLKCGQRCRKINKKNNKQEKLLSKKKLGLKTGTQEIPHILCYADRIRKRREKMCELNAETKYCYYSLQPNDYLIFFLWFSLTTLESIKHG